MGFSELERRAAPLDFVGMPDRARSSENVFPCEPVPRLRSSYRPSLSLEIGPKESLAVKIMRN